MNYFFTSVPLAKKLLQHQLTLVRIMTKRKREIPVCMEAAKSRQTRTSVFGFSDQTTMVSYTPKKDKTMIILSTMHQCAKKYAKSMHQCAQSFDEEVA